MTPEPVLIAGEWRASDSTGSFQPENPATRKPLDATYPVSSWADCDAALDAAADAFAEMRRLPGERIGAFLERLAALIEERSDSLVEIAHLETALPKTPRLADVELPRTTAQLRQAAAAARTGNWRQPVIDSANDIRSCYGPIGPVCVFGPNNFPFAFGSASGGDFAAAIAAGNPVIAKANSSHPGATELFAAAAHDAARETDMPAGVVQLLYRTSHPTGEQLVTDPRLGATGYTGSRKSGLRLKRAADGAGKPIYLELSSVNPVVVLPHALDERPEELAEEFTGSCLMGAGQFCTNPGIVILVDGDASSPFVEEIVRRFREAPSGTLLSHSVAKSLHHSHEILIEAGAEVLCGTGEGSGDGYSVANTLLSITAERFLDDPLTMQTEAFGNSSLLVTAPSVEVAARVIESLEGNLTGSIYSASSGADDADYERLVPTAAIEGGPSPRRQDAHRRGRIPGHEPRRPLSGDGTSGLHGRGHPRLPPAVRDAAVLRQRPPAPPAGGSPRRLRRRGATAHRRGLDLSVSRILRVSSPPPPGSRSRGTRTTRARPGDHARTPSSSSGAPR